MNRYTRTIPYLLTFTALTLATALFAKHITPVMSMGNHIHCASEAACRGLAHNLPDIILMALLATVASIVVAYLLAHFNRHRTEETD